MNDGLLIQISLEVDEELKIQVSGLHGHGFQIQGLSALRFKGSFAIDSLRKHAISLELSFVPET